MRVIAAFNSKGGSGKSTLSMHLAVKAAEHYRTVILDTDPNGTTVLWSSWRENPQPSVEEATTLNLGRRLDELQTMGVELVILDCPPSITADSPILIGYADFVIMPVQPTMPDVGGCLKALKIVTKAKKPFGFILSRVPKESPDTRAAREALKESGPLCPVDIGDRIAFSRALAAGLAVTEFDMDAKAVAEIGLAADWILKQAGVTHG